jgi:hypothetical protein
MVEASPVPQTEASPDLAASEASRGIEGSREIEAPWAITEALPAVATEASPTAAKSRTTAVSAETATPATPTDLRRAGDPASTVATRPVAADTLVDTLAEADTAAVVVATAAADTVAADTAAEDTVANV